MAVRNPMYASDELYVSMGGRSGSWAATSAATAAFSAADEILASVLPSALQCARAAEKFLRLATYV